MEQTRRHAGLLVLLAVLAASCGAGDRLTESAAERLIEEAAGVDNIDVNTEDGTITVETSEGSVTTRAGQDDELAEVTIEGSEGIIEGSFGAGELPEDFPSALPVPAAYEISLAQALTQPDGTRLVSVYLVPVDQDYEQTVADLDAKFESAADLVMVARKEGDVLTSVSWDVEVDGLEGTVQAISDASGDEATVTYTLFTPTE